MNECTIVWLERVRELVQSFQDHSRVHGLLLNLKYISIVLPFLHARLVGSMYINKYVLSMYVRRRPDKAALDMVPLKPTLVQKVCLSYSKTRATSYH